MRSCLPIVEPAELQLEWADQPTIVLVEFFFERRSAVEVEGTDVPTLFDLARFVLEEDPKRQTLGPTDNGADLLPRGLDRPRSPAIAAVPRRGRGSLRGSLRTEFASEGRFRQAAVPSSQPVCVGLATHMQLLGIRPENH